jgi:hypothetical protein
MKSFTFTITAAAAVLFVPAVQAQLDLKVYTDHTEIGNGPGPGVATTANSGLTFSGLVSDFSVPAVDFGASLGNFDWHPTATDARSQTGLSSFAADFTGSILAAGGTYHISLFSDDASYMYIDGILQISRPGAHGPDSTSADIPLSAGTHTVQVEFYECCGGPSGVDAVLPQGISITPTIPDAPSTMALLGGTFALIAGVSRRLRA